MKRKLLLPLCILAITTCAPRLHAQIENTTVGQFFKSIDMVAMPPSWQPYIGPGSIIYVDWAPHEALGVTLPGYSYRGKFLDNPPTNLPANLPKPSNDSVTSGAVQKLQSTNIDLSVVLGKIAPSLRIGHGTRINYPQTTFKVVGWGRDAHATNAALASPTIKANLTDGTYDTSVNENARMFRGYGQGYLVTSVFTVENLRIDVTDQTQVDASVQALRAGDCTKEIPASQLPDPSKPPAGSKGTTPGSADSTTPSTTGGRASGTVQPTTNPATATPATTKAKDDADAAPGAKTVLPSIAFSDAKVSVCRYNNNQFDLKVSPGVPIAFTAIEIHYDPLLPKAYVQGKTQELRDAMKFPD